MGGPENERRVRFFLALVLLFLWMHYTAAPPVLMQPKKDPKFMYFFVTATTFLTVLARRTRLKTRVRYFHSSHSLAVGLA